MTHEDGERLSVGQLVSNLSEQAARLVRAEIDLAKAELAEKAKAAGIGIGLLVGAGLIGFFTLATGIALLIIALAVAWPAWLAALVVFVLLLVITAVLALLGINKLKAGVPPTPEKAVQGVKDDAAAVKQSAKEGLQR